VNFNSTLLDLNEFMSDTGGTASTDTTASYGVIAVPKNIDFVLKSSIKTVKVMNFTMTNAAGDVIVKEGVANLSGLRFNMLGGSFVVNGAYDTKNLAHPKYDFALKIENVSMRQAANTSTLVQTFAPIAGLVNGNFSSDFKLSGELLPNMMPNLTTVNGGGLIKIAQAALNESKILSSITSVTKLDNTNEVTFKDVMMSASLKDGRMSVKPFDVKFGNYKTTVSGSTGLDKSIDYSLKMDVPAGKLGAEFNSFIASKTGAKTDPNGTIPITIGLGGTVTDPAPKLLMDEQKEQVKEAAIETAKEEGTKAVEKAVKGTDAEKVVKDILGTSKDSAQAPGDTTATTSTTEDAQKKLEEDAKKKIQDFLKKKS
jgi:AsmA-like C-terminal region